MIKGAIFDIDGTLVDSVDLHAQAWVEAFQMFGKEIPFQQIRSQIGKGGDQLMPVFLSDKEMEVFSEDLEKYRSEHWKRNYLNQVRPFSKVRELFERLAKDGYKIALASSAKEEEIDTYKKIAHISDLVQTDASADDAERSKPHPDIFEATLKKIGLTSSEVLVIGDSPYDAIGAGKIGIGTLGLLSGGFPESELRKAGAIEIYRDPEDLLLRYDQSPFVKMKSVLS